MFLVFVCIQCIPTTHHVTHIMAVLFYIYQCFVALHSSESALSIILNDSLLCLGNVVFLRCGNLTINAAHTDNQRQSSALCHNHRSNCHLEDTLLFRSRGVNAWSSCVVRAGACGLGLCSRQDDVSGTCELGLCDQDAGSAILAMSLALLAASPSNLHW